MVMVHMYEDTTRKTVESHAASAQREADLHAAAYQRDMEYREIDRLVREVHVCKVTTENHDALLMRAGFKQPGDAPLGPTGNLDFQPTTRR